MFWRVSNNTAMVQSLCTSFPRGIRVPAGFFVLVLLLGLLAPAVSGAENEGAPLLKVEDGRLLDQAGRQVFLWGMNVGEKSSARRHESWHEAEDFRNLRRWGMNAVRLLLFWSAIEPEPGRYDETYLASVDASIARARDAGLYVILDMHQDLWSAAVRGGNGAPAWATLDDGLPHFTLGSVWSTAYYVSPQIHRAFDNFWKNAPGPDGVGIQERFALAWRHVAERYADTPAVIGFDLMNEPFPGSAVQDILPALVAVLPDILEGTSAPGTLTELRESLSNTPLPPWLLEALDDPDRHRHVLEAIRPTMERFEREQLMPMYRRVHAAIREVHPHGIFFLEPCVLANVGVPTAIEALCSADGARDPLQAYLPHAYDLVTDTNLVHQPSKNRLQLIVAHKRRDADRLGMPLFIGEWGAYYGSPKTQNAARLMNELLEKYTHGAFYWEYHRHIEQTVYFEVLAKPAPLSLAGMLDTWQFSPDTNTLTCRWKNVPASGISRFALPASWPVQDVELRVEPDGLSATIESSPVDPEVRTIAVSASRPVEAATLTFSLRRQF